MKVVALVSGGKDSCYVMLKCLSYGHEIVALAHITPRDNVEEMDSFMYQSIGTKAIPALAEALDLPLYTRETSAKACVTSLAYAPTSVDDEVEDLYLLLQDVKEAHPDVSAVCAGALWSDYQRLRVESAASRAGLLSLAYLWRRDQTELLDEMVSAGVHAVLVKVAAVGLNESHLGQSLAQMKPVLKRLEDAYGVHVCGEGGEYESLVLSLPTFSKDLVLGNDVSVVCHVDDPVAPVYYLSIPRMAFKKDEVASQSDTCAVAKRLPPVPPIPEPLRPLEGDFVPDKRGEIPESDVMNGEPPSRYSPDEVSVSSRCVSGYIHAVAHAPDVLQAANALRDTIRELRPSLECATEREEEPLADILFVWLYVETLSGEAYAAANSKYVSVFGVSACTPPPARACVGMRGFGSRVTLEALARPGRRKDPLTKTLHVQSVSEWAPPCIGPYAQTVCDAGVAHVCGVLPLHAPTVSIPLGLGVRAQARGCMYNMGRTLDATSAGGLSRLALLVAYVTAEEAAAVVEEEVRNWVRGPDPLVAIVPVDSLPKAALVEIRSVGCLGEERPEVWVGSVERPPGSSVGRLRYAVVEVKGGVSGSEVSAKDLVSEIDVKQVDDVDLLSLQIFCNNSAGVCSASVMRVLDSSSDGLPCAKIVADVQWLAHGASLMSIATFVAREPVVQSGS